MRLPQRLRAAATAGALTASSLIHPAGKPGGEETRSSLPGDGVRTIRWPTTYEWPAAAKWVSALHDGLARHVAVEPAEIAQPFEGAVVIEVQTGGAAHPVAIDYFDRDRLLNSVVQSCELVFKMQYRAGGYGHQHVVPGGYMPGRPYLPRYLGGLRYLRDTGHPRFDVYGRFGLSYAPEVRRRAVEMLRAQEQFRYEGSLTLLPYSAYLREAALSHVCIDLPGNGDMCHRLIDYLAIGCCIVRPAARTTLPEPLADGVHIRYVREDLSDLVDACEALVRDTEAAARIGRAARAYYDRHLRADALAAYYLERCAVLLGG
ncbi:MAG: glycosyltransferase family protein [Solirubrobacteraceae bacterium]